MLTFFRSSAFWRGCAGALFALLLALAASVAWHAYQDHQAHHRMVGLWIQYGPLLEQARQQQAAKPSPTPRSAPSAAPDAAQEK